MRKYQNFPIENAKVPFITAAIKTFAARLLLKRARFDLYSRNSNPAFRSIETGFVYDISYLRFLSKMWENK